METVRSSQPEGIGGPASMLVITTVAETMGFLLPFVHHFRTLGWQVDGCARGITENKQAVRLFR